MARHLRTLVLATAWLALCAPTGHTQDGRFVSVEEIRPGDRCVGRSVFAGTDVEEFDIEILGVVRGTAPGSDLIIGRAKGELLERTGIPQGMSGSPVYLDGRLLGAISATWPFSKEPIAGITPIEEMLPALEQPHETAERPGTSGFGIELVPPPERERCRMAALSRLAGAAQDDGARDDPYPVATYAGREMSRMSLPLVVSGGTGQLLDAASGLLGGLGFSPVQGSGGGSADPAPELVPGSSVGVQFVGGDMTWAAIGTLTYVDDGRVLAFGHPVFGAGAVDMPLVGAYVHAILPLVSVSLKYASGTEPVGTIYSDRRRGVGGSLGDVPRTMPLSVSVRQGAAEGTSYHFDVIRTRPFSSLFAGLAAAGAVTEAAQTTGRVSVSFRSTVETTRGPVSYDALFQTMEPALRTGGELGALLDIIMDSALEGVEVTGASLQVDVSEGRLVAALERVTADRSVYRPGDTVRLRAGLRDWKGGVRHRTFELRVPDGAPDGPLIVRVGGAASFHEWDAERLGGGLRPRTWEQLRDLIESSRPGNTIVAQLLSGRRGLSLSGREIVRAPGRAALVMGSISGSGAVAPAELTVLSEVSLETEWETLGYHEFVIYVHEKP